MLRIHFAKSEMGRVRHGVWSPSRIHRHGRGDNGVIERIRVGNGIRIERRASGVGWVELFDVLVGVGRPLAVEIVFPL